MKPTRDINKAGEGQFNLFLCPNGSDPLVQYLPVGFMQRVWNPDGTLDYSYCFCGLIYGPSVPTPII
jgi:hypothetical protein